MVFSVTLASGLIINVKAVSKEEVLLRFPDARTIVENPAIRDTTNLPSVGRDGILRMAGSGEILTDADIESGRAAGTVFTPTTESTDPDDILAEFLSGVQNRGVSFDRNVVDPALRFGGSTALRNALSRGFDPVNAAFELKGLLASEDEVENLPEFGDFVPTGSRIPTVEAIRGLLREVVRRQALGTGAPGGLTGGAALELEDEKLQGRLITAASGTRRVPGFLRDSFRTAFRRRLQAARLATPAGNLIEQFVSGGFRL